MAILLGTRADGLGVFRLIWQRLPYCEEQPMDYALSPRYEMSIWVAWNLVLAIFPVLLGRSIGALASRNKPLAWALLPVWLAFLPNTCYLLTE